MTEEYYTAQRLRPPKLFHGPKTWYLCEGSYFVRRQQEKQMDYARRRALWEKDMDTHDYKKGDDNGSETSTAS